MSDQHQPPESDAPQPPVSTFVGAVDQLVREGRLAPPVRPGLLAALDRFEVIKLIGAGGMGLVFLARDPETDGQVAIKLLKPELAVNELARRHFIKEARLMKRLEHAGIIPVLELSDHPERPYFVMPYLAQGSLAGRIGPGQPLAQDQVLPIALRVGQALQFAHGKSIIHRDLKPANILLDARGNACLTDFGLARTLYNDSLVDLDRGHCEGTAPYMSPQIVAAEAEDTRGDVYAFGCLLYEMLTGQPPYEGPSTEDILRQIREQAPPPVTELNPDASVALVTVTAGAMERDQRDRYANMTDVVADLERVQNGAPPKGPHPQWRMGRSARRRRIGRRTGIGAAVAGLVLLAFLGLVYPGWIWPWTQPALVTVRQFELPGIFDWSSARLANWDGDNEADLILMQAGQCQVVTSRGQARAPFGPAEPHTSGPELTGVLDLNNDGLDEALLTWAEGTNTCLAAFNQYGWLVKQFCLAKPVLEHPEHGTIHYGLGSGAVMDDSGTGRRRLLTFCSRSWGPRSLCAFDLEQQTLDWDFAIAPYPIELTTADLTGDGNAEVLIGSNAVDNRVQLPDGTDDSHSYLYAVNAEGKLLWRRQTGGVYSRSHALCFRVASESACRVYGWAWVLRFRQKTNDTVAAHSLFRLNPADGTPLARYDLGDYIMTCTAADLDGDGTNELIAADQAGYLHVLDADLRLRRKVQVMTNRFDRVECELVAVTHLTAGPKPYLVVKATQCEIIRDINPGNVRDKVNITAYHDNVVLVLDAALHVVRRHLLAKRSMQAPQFKVAVANMDEDPQPEVVLLSKDVQVLKLRDPWLARVFRF